FLISHDALMCALKCFRISQAEFGAEVTGKSERNERIATKPRRPLLDPIRMQRKEPCVRI
ncbi:hypothetical protein PIB30_037753, partial [Stylosanthes scabra]|nr:hypothetical protein [Stylosanthes scabra]